MTGRIVHFQVGADDTDRLANFYGQVFGWTLTDARLTSVDADRSGPYRFVSGGEAGISGGVTGVGPKGVVLTVEVVDIAETLARAERLGARRGAGVEPERLRLEVGGTTDTTFAVHGFVDPEGNSVQILAR